MSAIPHRTPEQLEADVHEARRAVEQHAHGCATLNATGLECQRCLELEADLDAAARRRDAAASQTPERVAFERLADEPIGRNPIERRP